MFSSRDGKKQTIGEPCGLKLRLEKSCHYSDSMCPIRVHAVELEKKSLTKIVDVVLASCVDQVP